MRRRSGVVIWSQNHEVLLLKRIKHGEVYYVIPGGGAQNNESDLNCAIRELSEEIGLVLQADILLFMDRIEDQENIETYYYTKITKREFTIGGEEKERSSVNNIYIPLWVSHQELKQLDVRPKLMKEKLLAFLE